MIRKEKCMVFLWHLVSHLHLHRRSFESHSYSLIDIVSEVGFIAEEEI